MYFNRNPLYLEAARLAGLGYRVFPCVPGAKRPLTAHGLKDATTDILQLRAWWGDHPRANVAIATDGLLVVDCDVNKTTGEANPWLSDDLDKWASLQNAPTAQTPRGGLHLVFRQPAGHEFRNTASKLAPGIDTRATGGYIVVSPSQVDGKPYAWRTLQRLECRPDELPEPPEWLVEQLSGEPGGVSPGTLYAGRQPELIPALTGPGSPEAFSSATGATGSASASAIDLRIHEDTGTANGTQATCSATFSPSPMLPLSPSPQPASERIPEGTRHDSLVRYAGQMRRFGASASEIHAALRDRNARLCQPPLPDDEVAGIATGVARYPEHPPLAALINVAPGYATPATDRGKLIELASVEPEDVSWLWPGRIPLGKVTLLCGDPGVGKSFLTIDITARVSRGADWPDALEFSASPGKVILLNAEDSLNDTIRPRLEWAGAIIDNVSALDGIIIQHTAGDTTERSFDLTRDIHILREALDQKGDIRLVVIDPVSAYCGQIDSHKNTDVRALLKPLQDLAAEYDVAVLLVTHLSKSNAPGRAVYRAMGSLAFAAASRTVWLVDKHPQHPDLRIWVPVKLNCATMPTALGYRLVDGHLQWDDTPILHTADELLSGVINPKVKELKGYLAAEWLQDFLRDGPKEASEVFDAAERVGLSPKQINKAKGFLEIQPKKEPRQGGKWVWELPLTQSPQPSICDAGEVPF